MDRPMMECGHTANATRTSDGAPVCAICFGSPAATIAAAAPPDLTGRMMRCSYAKGDGTPARNGGTHTDRPSSSQAAFFEHRPTEDVDRFYCGCWGWD